MFTRTFAFTNAYCGGTRYMLEGGGSKMFSKCKGWIYAHPAAARELLALISDVSIKYLVGQARAGAQILQVCASARCRALCSTRCMRSVWLCTCGVCVTLSLKLRVCILNMTFALNYGCTSFTLSSCCYHFYRADPLKYSCASITRSLNYLLIACHTSRHNTGV